MRLPTLKFFGTTTPSLGASDGPVSGLGRLGKGSISRLLKTILDVAFVLTGLMTALMVILLVVSLFIPLDNINISVSEGPEGRQLPLSRPLLLFGVGAVTAYFSGFLLILQGLRKIMRTLILGDPFQPENVRRLRQIGLTLAIVTFGVWLSQLLVSRFLAPGIMDPQGLKDLLTPIFSLLIVFVLAEIFREGARLRRESELTI